jgi:hypothetical protein
MRRIVRSRARFVEDGLAGALRVKTSIRTALRFHRPFVGTKNGALQRRRERAQDKIFRPCKTISFAGLKNSFHAPSAIVSFGFALCF